MLDLLNVRYANLPRLLSALRDHRPFWWVQVRLGEVTPLYAFQDSSNEQQSSFVLVCADEGMTPVTCVSNMREVMALTQRLVDAGATVLPASEYEVDIDVVLEFARLFGK